LSTINTGSFLTAKYWFFLLNCYVLGTILNTIKITNKEEIFCKEHMIELIPSRHMVLIQLEAVSKLLSSRERAKFSLARRRFKITAGVAKATSRMNFVPTTPREEIAAVRSRN
jgi:hypothetical protein